VTYAIRRGPDPDDPSYERVTLVSPDGVEAAFVPLAGMAGTSFTLDGVELLARRGGLAAYTSEGSTFGIPLLAPWANRLASPHQSIDGVSWDVPIASPGVHHDEFGQPIHGLVPASPGWEVIDAEAHEACAGLRARWSFDPALERFALFPFQHTLDVDVSLSGRTLRVVTTLTATGDRAVPVAFGWHPWFEFPDVPRAEWELSAPFTRRALLGDTKIPTGEVVLDPAPPGRLGELVLDDVYVGVADETVATLRAGARGVAVRYVSGYDVAVVFAPATHDLVCIEPMTAPTDPFSGRFPLRLAHPGESVEAVYEIEATRH
jgi:galactose mutarotase-like enzyme